MIFFLVFFIMNTFLHVTCSDFVKTDIKNLQDDCGKIESLIEDENRKISDSEEKIKSYERILFSKKESLKSLEKQIEEEKNEQQIRKDRFACYKRLFFDPDDNDVTIENVKKIDLKPKRCFHQNESNKSENGECDICKKIGKKLKVYNLEMVRYVFDKEYQDKDMIKTILSCDVIGFTSEDLFHENQENNLEFFILRHQINTMEDYNRWVPICSISSLIILRKLIEKKDLSVDEVTEYINAHRSLADYWPSILFKRDSFVADVKKWIQAKNDYEQKNTQIDKENNNVIVSNVGYDNGIKNDQRRKIKNTTKINNGVPFGKKIARFLCFFVVAGLGMYGYKTGIIRNTLTRYRKSLFVGGVGLVFLGLCKYFSQPFFRIIGRGYKKYEGTKEISKQKREHEKILLLLRPGDDSKNVILCCEARDCYIGAPMANPVLKVDRGCFFALFNEEVKMSDFNANLVRLADFRDNSRTFFLKKGTREILYRVVILEAKKIIKKTQQKQTLYISGQLAYDFLSHHEQSNENSLLNQEFPCITKDENKEITGECTIKFVAVDNEKYKLAADGSFPFSQIY